MELTNNNYYSQNANQEYFSVSQVKDFLKCEAYAMAKLNGEWAEEPSTPMLIGSYVDSYFEGTLDDFKQRTPEIFKKDGTLKAEYVLAENVINKIESDELFMLCLSGQKQVIMTGEFLGAQWKIKMDSYIEQEAIVDLKIVKKVREIFYSRGGRQSFIENWGYDLQLAVYQEIVKQNTGSYLDCIIAAADKQKYPDIACILLPNDQLDFQRRELAFKMPRIIAVKSGRENPQRCGICDYCRATKKLDRLVSSYELVT